MNPQRLKKQQRLRRRRRVRSLVAGTLICPRLSVYRSLQYMYAQLIDDNSGKTLVSASTHETKLVKKNNQQAAAQLGKIIAQKAKASGITQAVFDKSFYKYHGRIKALADAARKQGLKF